ncbi:rho GTPase-activating protein 22 [Thecamonas trahens ATCC 50062]|uniref:Rho GTPase-activating protein 22 n=1 Tax=Thecamonas trahens ATCC 50062 TaxID=461836 RepID=A0A0L0DQ75_THETB|nr:rho GTPase-activating protein 22 [Thecamonas trahens ATCC 50062]KNC54459.1 rho GTPase-activating protein 22 [Thecamonas trahens ATCC 50062]|eukprot:XP_013753614.1 rho GTPase-activating protein 22 [Thecamonas trahens ATCC 50062]
MASLTAGSSAHIPDTIAAKRAAARYELRKESGMLAELTATVATAVGGDTVYATQLWDVPEKVHDNCAAMLEATNEVAAYWRARAAIEADYAAALAKLSKSTKDKASFVNVPGWNRLVPLLDVEATQHAELATEMVDQLHAQLSEFASTMDTNLKLLGKVHRSLVKDAASAADNASKLESKYISAAQAEEIASSELRVAVTNKAKASKIAKLEKDVGKKAKAVAEAQEKYVAAIDEANAIQRKQFALLSSYESLELRRDERTIQQLNLYLELRALSLDKVAAAAEAAQDAISSHHPTENLELLPPSTPRASRARCPLSPSSTARASSPRSRPPSSLRSARSSIPRPSPSLVSSLKTSWPARRPTRLTPPSRPSSTSSSRRSVLPSPKPPKASSVFQATPLPSSTSRPSSTRAPTPWPPPMSTSPQASSSSGSASFPPRSFRPTSMTTLWPTTVPPSPPSLTASRRSTATLPSASSPSWASSAPIRPLSKSPRCPTRTWPWSSRPPSSGRPRTTPWPS